MTNIAKKYNTSFSENNFVYVKDFIDESTIATLSKYLEYRVAQQNYLTDEYTKISIYGDPLLEVILENSLASMEYITGKELYPTYSFGRVYLTQEDLPKHTDRESCEYTATINVACVGKKWPISLKNKSKKEVSFVLNPGDAVIYKGIEVEHWRDGAKGDQDHILVQFMLHYVDKNGPFSSYKWDKRSGLGLKRV